MKPLVFKNVIPAAVVAFGIAGAFATMSMQSANVTPKIGYARNAQGPCDIPVDCDTEGSQVCRLNGTSGPQAFGKNAQGNCNEVLFRPGS